MQSSSRKLHAIASNVETLTQGILSLNASPLTVATPILTPVKDQCNIIPSEFAEDGYKLFGELSDVVHGDYDEDEALQKFDAFYRLVTGVLEKIKTNRELMDAIGTLGWHTGGEENE
mgnify:CR=1 FL=1